VVTPEGVFFAPVASLRGVVDYGEVVLAAGLHGSVDFDRTW
jgi:hypothetical protein